MKTTIGRLKNLIKEAASSDADEYRAKVAAEVAFYDKAARAHLSDLPLPRGDHGPTATAIEKLKTVREQLKARADKLSAEANAEKDPAKRRFLRAAAYRARDRIKIATYRMQTLKQVARMR